MFGRHRKVNYWSGFLGTSTFTIVLIARRMNPQVRVVDEQKFKIKVIRDWFPSGQLFNTVLRPSSSRLPSVWVSPRKRS